MERFSQEQQEQPNDNQQALSDSDLAAFHDPEQWELYLLTRRYKALSRPLP
jgi:hypothetical protein